MSLYTDPLHLSKILLKHPKGLKMRVMIYLMATYDTIIELKIKLTWQKTETGIWILKI